MAFVKTVELTVSSVRMLTLMVSSPASSAAMDLE